MCARDERIVLGTNGNVAHCRGEGPVPLIAVDSPRLPASKLKEPGHDEECFAPFQRLLCFSRIHSW